MAGSNDIAIVGMACIFPGAPDLATYWRNLRAGVDAISDVPATRWDSVFYDPKATTADRFYCRRGGFVDAFASFDAAAHGIMPVAAQGAEPDQLLTLDVATRALADAGYADRAFARERTGVILGRGNYAGAGRTRLEQHVRTAEQVVTVLRGLIPDLSEAELLRIKREFQSQITGIGADAAIGLVPNLTASRLSNRLDLHGPAFTVDAACASALVAVELAASELASGRCDMVLAGGVHLCHDEAFWSVFCQLGALSRAQQIRPFDRRADGLLIGEGLGVVVLKRLADAQRDDDRIYAVVRGTGTSSDGRDASLMNPSVAGQLKALERAWAAAGVDASTVGLVEAHGTGTNAGDAAEMTTLQRFFGRHDGDAPRPVLGSVKSMIGHAMPAAGIAGLIKSALALHHGVLLPTLHCEEPIAALESSRFRVIAREEPWERAKDSATPRRAGVNAFGFGGINGHVVLEEHAAAASPSRGRSKASSSTDASTRVALFAATSQDTLIAALDANAEHRSGAAARGPRLAVLDPTPVRLARARVIAEKARPWRGREGIWYSPAGLISEGGRIAFVFPGVDASFEPRVEDVAERFGHPVPPCIKAENLEEVGIGIIGVNRLLYRVLGEIGLVPDVVAGHSIGEWSGMIATGIVPEAAVDEFMGTLERGSLKVPGVVFAAAGCSVARATAAMTGLVDIGISHDNCPHQVIFCGVEASVDLAVARLLEDGVLSQKLPFQSGFHSPLFADYVGPHRANFERLPLRAPSKPLFSATSVELYPSGHAELCELAIDHLVKPVRFRELVERLYADGARAFVQVGTGSLVNFVEDTLRGKPHVVESANVKDRSGLAQLRRLAAALFVEGADLHWEKLVTPPPPAARPPMPLALGAPMVRMKTPLARAAYMGSASASASAPLPAAFAATGHPLASIFATSMDELARAQTDVLAGFAEHAASSSSDRPLRPREATFTRMLSIGTFPELIDHSFFRQPPTWKNLSDKHPVVPMTTLIEIMADAARALVPERIVLGLDDVRAFRWLAISKPVDAKISCSFDGISRVAITIGDYCEGTVVLGEAFPEAPAADVAPLTGGALAGLTGRELYDQRWMFHGPQFQGIVDVGTLGDDAIRGVLEAAPARGALLDNAGQLFGYWVMVKNVTNRMAMPVKIDRIRFYGDPPTPGDKLACTVHIRKHAEREVIADLSLARDEGRGAVWCTLDGWEDRRFDTDARLWAVMMFPEDKLLATPQPEGLVVLNDTYRSAPTRDQLARRFLTEAERAQYDKQYPKVQRAWLTGRIAAKDAIRDFLWRDGHASIFPAEISLDTDASGRLVVRSIENVTRDLRISSAHAGEVAVAMVAEGRDVGVHVERVEPRVEAFVASRFVESELRMLDADAEQRDESLARLLVAKEACAKARGMTPASSTSRFTVRDRSGARLLVDGTWVQTRREGDYIFGWTLP